jgi:hypothetical protein
MRNQMRKAAFCKSLTESGAISSVIEILGGEEHGIYTVITGMNSVICGIECILT